MGTTSILENMTVLTVESLDAIYILRVDLVVTWIKSIRSAFLAQLATLLPDRTSLSDLILASSHMEKRTWRWPGKHHVIVHQEETEACP